MSSVVTRTPAGTPSQIAASARPCDSPAVSHRNMMFSLPAAEPPPAVRPDRDRAGRLLPGFGPAGAVGLVPGPLPSAGPGSTPGRAGLHRGPGRPPARAG